MTLSDSILKKIETQIEFSNNLSVELITSVRKSNEILSKEIYSELKIQTGLLKGIIGALTKSAQKSESKKDVKGLDKLLGKIGSKDFAQNLAKAEKPLEKFGDFVKTLVDNINTIDEKKFNVFNEFINTIGVKILKFSLFVALAAPLLLIGALFTLPILFLWVKLFEYIGNSEKEVYKGAKTLMYIASSTAIVVLTIVLSSLVLGSPENLLSSFLLVTGSMLLLVGVFFLINLISKPVESGAKTILFLVLTTVLVVGTILMVSYILGQMSDESKDNLWGAFGLVIGSLLGIVGAYLLINQVKGNLIQGGMTMFLIGLVTIIVVGMIIGVAYLLLDLKNKSGESDTSTFGIVAGAVGIVVISLLAVGLTVALLGSMTGQLLPGALGMLIVSASLLVFSLALQKFIDSGVTSEDILLLGGSLTAISLIATLLGNPFTVGFTFAGAGALLLLSGALYVFTGSLVNFKQSKWSSTDTESLKSTVSEIVYSIRDVFSDFGLADFAKTMAGVVLLGGIGNSLSSLAKGLSYFANLQIVNYIKDEKTGELIIDPKSSKESINPQAIGEGIKRLVAPLIDKDSILYNLGKGEGTFFAGPVGKGIKLLGKLGNSISNFAKGLMSMADLKMPFYDKDGMLVPNKFTQIPPDFGGKISDNIKMMVQTLTKPLEELGSKSGTFFNSDYENGLEMLSKLGKPLQAIASAIKDFSNEKLDVSKIEPTIKGLVNPLNTFFSKKNLDNLDIEKGIKLLNYSSLYVKRLTELEQPEKISKMFVDIGTSINKIDLKKLEKLNSLARNLAEFAKQMSGNFSELSEVLEKLTIALDNIDTDKVVPSIPLNQNTSNIKSSSANTPNTSTQTAQTKEVDITPMVKELKSILATLQGGIEVEPRTKLF